MNNTNPLAQSLSEMQQRIEELHQLIPPFYKDGNDAVTDDMVNRIYAIEGEWLVNPEDREEFGTISYD